MCSSFLYPPLHKPNGIYYSLEYCGVEPRTEAMFPSVAPFILPSTSAFIGLGPIRVSNQASFNTWFKTHMCQET